MKWLGKFVVGSGIFFLAVAFAFPQAAFASDQVVIEELQGNVQIVKTGQAQTELAALGTVLQPGDKLETGKDGSVKIKIENTGEIKLEKETTWSYEEFSSDKDTKKFKANLALGRLKAKVQKLPTGSIFEIKTPTSIAAVRGTFLGLFVYLLNQQYFTFLEVFEDSVVFSNLSGDQSYVVGEGENATGTQGGDVSPPEESKSNPLGEGNAGGGGADDTSTPNPISETLPGQEYKEEVSSAQDNSEGAPDDSSSSSSSKRSQSGQS